MRKDSFLDCLEQAASILKLDLTRSYFAVRTGHWLRISLAMSVKRQEALGHPSADGFWDHIALMNKYYPDAGIDAMLYIGKKRITLAKETSAQGKRIIESEKIHILSSPEGFKEKINQFYHNNAILILFHKHGVYLLLHKSSNKLTLEDVNSNLTDYYSHDLGPVLIIINNMTPQEGIPWNSLEYLSWTFERGEEPTEVTGHHGHSAVSGWKAYARWIQGYLLKPKEKSIHSELQYLPELLIDRRTSAIEYLEILAKETRHAQLSQLFTDFVDVAKRTIEELSTLHQLYQKQASHQELRSQITKVYFTEQETLPIFKRFKRFHHDLVVQRLD